MLKNVILGLGLVVLVSCAKSSGSGTSSNNAASGTSESDLASLRASVSSLQSQINSDYSSNSLQLSSVNYQAIQNDFTTILNYINIVKNAINSNTADNGSADFISAVSDVHCLLNTGNCPLTLIKTILDGYSTNYDDAIQNIDLQMDLAVQDINLEFAPISTSSMLALADSHPTVPTSGFEIAYEPASWNDSGSVQYNTNCYAYSLNLQKEATTGKAFPLYENGFALQPGDIANHKMSLSDGALNDPTGSEIIKLAEADAAASNSVFEPVQGDVPSPTGTYKVALVIAPNLDYHWYRQNPDGTWSHKPGATSVRAVDASDNVIWDPKVADRGASGPLNYTWFVGYFAVKSIPLH